MPKIEAILNLKIQSPNVMEHWSSRYKRNEFNHKLIKSHLFGVGIAKVEIPCKIILERTGSRLYDQDNYVFSCKGIKDSLAALIQGKKRGQDDDNPALEWVYCQKKGKPSFRIEITWGENNDMLDSTKKYE